MRARVQSFVDANEGRLPDGAEWAGIVDINNLMDAAAGDLRRVIDIVRERLFADVVRRSPDGQLTPAATEEIPTTLLQVMQYESQVAAFLLFYAEGHDSRDPNTLQTLFDVKQATPLTDILRPVAPLALIDPNDRSGALSPVGFVHLFRLYYFNLGTFLGEPVEHVWLAPGTTIELVEASTRRVLVERTLEEMVASSRPATSEQLKRRTAIETRLHITFSFNLTRCRRYDQTGKGAVPAAPSPFAPQIVARRRHNVCRDIGGAAMILDLAQISADGFKNWFAPLGAIVPILSKVSSGS